MAEYRAHVALAAPASLILGQIRQVVFRPLTANPHRALDYHCGLEGLLPTGQGCRRPERSNCWRGRGLQVDALAGRQGIRLLHSNCCPQRCRLFGPPSLPNKRETRMEKKRLYPCSGGGGDGGW